MTKRTLCGDWSCPARVSCAHHFGRSAEYFRFRDRSVEYPGDAGPKTRLFARPDGADSCPHYAFDRPRAWLMPGAGQVTHLLMGV